MNNSIVQASKPGKLILLGEYAVLEQAPCLVAAADKNCTVRVEPNDGDDFKIKASNPDIDDVRFRVSEECTVTFEDSLSSLDRERLRFVIAVLNNVIERCDGDIEPADIYIDTTNFYHPQSGDKLGLGASASITVTLLSALREYIGEPVAGKALYEQAFPIHRKAQGKLGSGSDIAASAVGGVIQYRMPENVQQGTGVIEPLAWPEDLHVIPVWAGKSASTQDLVQQVRLYREQEPEKYKQVMDPMIELSQSGCNLVKHDDIEGLFEVINDYVQLERKLGKLSGTDIVSEAHRKIAQIITEAGSVYKPSGAGNGDMGVAFCYGDDNRAKIENVLTESSFDIVDLALQTSSANAHDLSAAN